MPGVSFSCRIGWTPGEFPQLIAQIPSVEKFSLPSMLWCLLSCVANKTIYLHLRQDVVSFMTSTRVQHWPAGGIPALSFPVLHVGGLVIWQIHILRVLKASLYCWSKWPNRARVPCPRPPTPPVWCLPQEICYRGMVS